MLLRSVSWSVETVIEFIGKSDLAKWIVVRGFWVWFRRCSLLQIPRSYICYTWVCVCVCMCVCTHFVYGIYALLMNRLTLLSATAHSISHRNWYRFLPPIPFNSAFNSAVSDLKAHQCCLKYPGPQHFKDTEMIPLHGTRHSISGLLVKATRISERRLIAVLTLALRRASFECQPNWLG